MKHRIRNTQAEDGSTDESEGHGRRNGRYRYDKVLIGLDDTFAPMGFRDENNELTGLT